jgi:hypothetical protein
MKRFLMTICLVVLAVSAALAQGKKSVPPPPKPAHDGPSLEVTMKFIQDKINGIGPVSYVRYIHDNVAGKDWAFQEKAEDTKFVADTSACRISYHFKGESDGTEAVDKDDQFLLKDVEDIVVLPGEQAYKEESAAAGHPSWSFRVDPPFFFLKVRKPDKRRSYIHFSDEQLANRVAKAMVHAVELCGGGGKPEPF